MSRASVIYVLVNSLALALERTQSATLLLGLEGCDLSAKPIACRLRCLSQKVLGCAQIRFCESGDKKYYL